MKKKTTTTSNILCTVLLCTALSCAVCACGTETDTADASRTDAAQDDADDSTADQSRDTDADTTAVEDAEQNTADSEDATEETGAEAGDTDIDPETDTTVSVFPSHIQITMQHNEEDLTANDGTVLCTTSYTYPVVSIEGNDDAAGKINEDIRSRVDSFLADTEAE